MGTSLRSEGGVHRRGERGYILALLLGICTVMVISLQKALPAVRSEVQRENEAELIYRGEHLARGLRMYQARTGGYPTSLDQLLKVNPKLIRRVYRDPMTSSGEWQLVYAVSPGASGDTSNLPIVGVRSRSPKDTLRMYQNKTIASDWVFSATDSILGLPGSGKDPGKPQGDPGKGDGGKGDGNRGEGARGGLANGVDEVRR
jgi:hypothetical protein